MLAGSVAGGAYGLSRATIDVDIVIAADEQQLETLLTQLPAEFYFNRDTAVAALRTELMFNVIDTATGLKADLIFRKSRPFSVAEFDQRAQAEVFRPAALDRHSRGFDPQQARMGQVGRFRSPIPRCRHHRNHTASLVGHRLFAELGLEAGCSRFAGRLLQAAGQPRAS